MASTPMIPVLDEDRHWWFATRTRAILAWLDRYVGPGKDRRVLDVGCGAANMTHHLRHYGQVVGVDNNPRPLAIARERGLEAYEGRADDLPFGAGEFDLVTLLDTVEHVPDQDRAFEECRRVLRGPSDRVEAGQSGGANRGRAAGKLLVTVPAFMFLWSHNDVINMHQRRYTAPELRAELERHGFRVLRISYNNFFVFPLAAGLILLRRGRAEPELASPHFDEEAYQVEMEPAPPLLNALLSGVGRIEAALLRRFDLPVGTSVIALAEKL
ncbi:MAG TPA: class I SAM-dependent methyltransferase [Anaerolineae bacterium]